ncbi:MAG: SDR family NAD(P)-dependent oxidoreductase, partial [Chthoniobacterales bacterium]
MNRHYPKRIFITGASRGLGLEFTSQFLKGGNHVFAACRDTSRATDLVKLKSEYPETCVLIDLDVGDITSIDTSFKTVQAQTDALDVFINNAAHTTDLHETLADIQPNVMLRHFQVNTMAPVLLAQKYLPLLRQGRDAKLATISSEAGGNIATYFQI